MTNNIDSKKIIFVE